MQKNVQKLAELKKSLYLCIVKQTINNKQKNSNMYGQENINEQWGEETAAEYFDRVRGYDGTERKDDAQYNFGCDIIGGLQDGYEPDTADRDIHDNFVQENIDRVQRYIVRAIAKAKENGEDTIEAAHKAVEYYDEYGLSDAEINKMIEAGLSSTPTVWVIGFRLNGEATIKTHETKAADGLAAWIEIRDYYQSGGDHITWAFTMTK